jgi:hypothetical protein
MAGLVDYLQAGYIDLPATTQQLVTIALVFLRVEAFDGERQTANLLPHLDAERADPDATRGFMADTRWCPDFEG